MLPTHHLQKTAIVEGETMMDQGPRLKVNTLPGSDVGDLPTLSRDINETLT